MNIVLASASAARLAMLRAAGITAIAEPASIDEDEIKRSLRAEGAPVERAAELLAELKAKRIATKHPAAYIIGGDQMLECEGRWFDKPSDRAGAAAQLRDLRGKTHRLVSSVVVLHAGQRIWHATDSAKLTMRPFSDAFLETYLDQMGATATHSVGAYQLEGRGVQLFSKVEGDFFTILGLPLLPLLDMLRTHKVLPE